MTTVYYATRDCTIVRVTSSTEGQQCLSGSKWACLDICVLYGREDNHRATSLKLPPGLLPCGSTSSMVVWSDFPLRKSTSPCGDEILSSPASASPSSLLILSSTLNVFGSGSSLGGGGGGVSCPSSSVLSETLSFLSAAFSLLSLVLSRDGRAFDFV